MIDCPAVFHALMWLEVNMRDVPDSIKSLQSQAQELSKINHHIVVHEGETLLEDRYTISMVSDGSVLVDKGTFEQAKRYFNAMIDAFG